MTITYKKIDDNTLGMTDEEVVTTESSYVYNDLVAIRDGLVNELSVFTTSQNEKIAIANQNIATADQFGIVPIIPPTN